MSTDRAESAEKFARTLNRSEAIQGTARGHIEALVREIESLSEALVERDVKLARIREAMSGHPKCDRYDDEVITCGWKRAYADVQHVMEGAQS